MPSLSQVFREVREELKRNPVEGYVAANTLEDTFTMHGIDDATGEPIKNTLILSRDDVTVYRDSDEYTRFDSASTFFHFLITQCQTYVFFRIPSYREYAFHKLKLNFLKERLDRLPVKAETDRVKVVEVFNSDEAAFYEIFENNREAILNRLDGRYRALIIASHWRAWRNCGLVYYCNGLVLRFTVSRCFNDIETTYGVRTHKLGLHSLSSAFTPSVFDEKAEQYRDLLDSKGLFDHEILFHDLEYIAKLLEMPTLLDKDPGEFNSNG